MKNSQNEVKIVAGPAQNILENVVELFDSLCDAIDITNSTISISLVYYAVFCLVNNVLTFYMVLMIFKITFDSAKIVHALLYLIHTLVILSNLVAVILSSTKCSSQVRISKLLQGETSKISIFRLIKLPN